MQTQRAFTLLELLTVVVIISLLIMLSYPTYTQHLLKTRRAQAQVALLDLASGMERYYLLYNTYNGATLNNLEINPFTESNAYQLAINQLTQDSYLLLATPLNQQTQDKGCGTLSLDSMGRKSISGSGSVEECWGE